MDGKKRSYLRGIGQSLKPTINLGKQGLSKSISKEIKTQLIDHELIKIRILNTCPLSKKECALILSNEEEIEVVQIIGKTLLLFCQQIDDTKKDEKFLKI